MRDLAKQTIVAALALGFVGAAGAWTGNSQEPPLGNSPAPLNVSSFAQSKQGSLGVGGLGVFGKAFVSAATGYTIPAGVDFGVNGTVGATRYCDQDGLNCFTASQVSGADTDTLNRLSCPSSPAVSTTVPDRPKWAGNQFTLPASCATDEGCVFKHEIWRLVKGNEVLWDTRFVEFRQTRISGTGAADWWSSYQPNKRLFNGDKTTTNVVRPVLVDETYVLAVRDDRDGQEIDPSKMVAYDNGAGWGQKLWICSYGSEPVI